MNRPIAASNVNERLLRPDITICRMLTKPQAAKIGKGKYMKVNQRNGNRFRILKAGPLNVTVNGSAAATPKIIRVGKFVPTACAKLARANSQ